MVQAFTFLVLLMYYQSLLWISILQSMKNKMMFQLLQVNKKLCMKFKSKHSFTNSRIIIFTTLIMTERLSMSYLIMDVFLKCVEKEHWIKMKPWEAKWTGFLEVQINLISHLLKILEIQHQVEWEKMEVLFTLIDRVLKDKDIELFIVKVKK